MMSRGAVRAVFVALFLFCLFLWNGWFFFASPSPPPSTSSSSSSVQPPLLLRSALQQQKQRTRRPGGGGRDRGGGDDGETMAPAAARKKNKTKPLIHFPLSVTSRALKPRPTKVTELPLLRIFLPSLIRSVEPEKFDYDIGIGADQGDAWFDHPGRTAEMIQWWNSSWEEAFPEGPPPPRLWFAVYDNTASRNVWAVNYIAQRAYEEGADYFYRVNDDTELYANQWSTHLTNALRQMPVPDLGVAGPKDEERPDDLLTHSMVGRPHFDCFGQYFSMTFGNFYSDDEIHNMYRPPYDFGAVPQLPRNATFLAVLHHVTVKHHVVPSRYNVKATRELYRLQLVIDHENLTACLARLLA